MLSKFELRGEEDIPHIILESDGKFLFEGKSYAENIFEIYSPVINWFDDFFKQENNEIDFTFRFEFINSSTSKVLLRILTIFEKIDKSRVKIHWYYPDKDVDIQQLGKDFESMTNLPFDYISYKEN